MTKEQAEKRAFNEGLYRPLYLEFMNDPQRANNADYQMSVGFLLRIALSGGTYHPKVYA